MTYQVLSAKPEEYNSLAPHPLQTWEWGEFRQKLGQTVVRIGEYKKDKLVNVYQLTFHSIPKLPLTIGYLPKSKFPEPKLMVYLNKLGKKHRAIFIKLEPLKDSLDVEEIPKEMKLIKGRPLFTKYNLLIDLTKSEEDLMASFKSKTRYNIRLASRKGIKIIHDSSPKAFEIFQRLTSDTTQRQKFYAHNSHYRQQMWQTMHKSGLAELFLAKHEKDVLAAWIIFKLNDTIYYPYGASSDQKRNLMAPNLLCWEIMRWGKEQGFKTFDLWGSLGPNPNTSHPWFGFHRFKIGYAPKLVEYIGTIDLVINDLLYYPFRLLNSLRWFFLRR